MNNEKGLKEINLYILGSKIKSVRSVIKLEKSDEFSKEENKLKKVLHLAKNQLEETQIIYRNLERNTVDGFSLVAMRKILCY